MKREFNVKFFAILVGVTACLVMGVHFLHGYQIKRNAGSLLEQARQAEDRGDLQEASEFLSNYLAFIPNNLDGHIDELIHYGLMLDKLSAPGAGHPTNLRLRFKSFFVLEKALRLEPQRQDLRRQVAKIAIEMGRFTDAQAHLDELDKSATKDGESEHLMGRCYEGLGDYANASKCYEDAIRDAPQQVESYEFRARVLLHHLNQPRQAEEVMKELIAKNGQSWVAFLARARFWHDLKSPEKAEQDIEEAQKLAPDEAEVILAAGQSAREKGKLGDARQNLNRGLKLHPANADLYLALAQVEMTDKHVKEAQACLEAGLSNVPEYKQVGILWALASLLIEKGEAPEDQIARLQKTGIPSAQIDLLNARMALHKENWLQAVQILERIRPQIVNVPEFSKQIDLYLGQAYHQVGDFDQEYAAYRRATASDPSLLAGHLGLAGALVSMGRIDEALAAYQLMIPLEHGARLGVARMLILKNLRLPLARRNWMEVDQALNEAARLKPEPPDLPLLRAEALVAQKKPGAQEILEKARTADPKQVELWTALANLADLEGRADRALAILDEAQAKLGDKVGIRLARATYWSKREGVPARTALAQLEKDWKQAQFSSEEQANLLRGLARAYGRLGDSKEGVRIWQQLADLRPWDLGVELVKFDLAFQEGNEAVMLQGIEHLKNLEMEGILWRYATASYLIWQAERQQGTGLDEAGQLLRYVAARRPDWSRVSLREGQIDDLKGVQGSAIKNYLRAIELGERNPNLIRRSAQMLYASRRFAEADQVIHKMPEQMPLSPEMQRLAAQLSLRHDPAGALNLVENAVPPESKNHQDHLWKAQMFESLDQVDRAEASYRKAAELGKDAPEPWVAFVSYLARSKQNDKAQAALREAEGKITPEKAPLALAYCYETVGQKDKAQQLNERALEDKGDDIPTVRAVALFYLRTNQAAKADPLLRKLIGLSKDREDAAWAKRVLAIVLATKGDYQQTTDALKILGVVDEGDVSGAAGESADDLRAQALVLTLRPSASQRRRSIPILEKLMDRQPTPDDQFLLARQYDAAGNWPKAKARFASLLTANGDNPDYLAYYTLALLRHHQAEEAYVWLAKLELLAGVARSFPLTEIKARLLAAKDKSTEAVAQVRDYVDSKTSKPDDLITRLQLGAALLDSLSQSGSAAKDFAREAEKIYREFAAAKQEGILALIGFLGRQGRLAEALESCEKAWQSCPPEAVAIAALTALQTTPGNEAQLERVERCLRSAKAKDSKTELMLLVSVAALRDFQGRHVESISLYRKALAQDPENPLALNNLAWLLILKEGNSEEALDLVDKAIKKMGPNSSLLDTRGVIYLTMSRTNQAIQDLEEAVATAPSPAKCFHLAEALQMGKQAADPKAKKAFEEGLRLGLKPERLHALERDSFIQLQKQLRSDGHENRRSASPIVDKSSHVSK